MLTHKTDRRLSYVPKTEQAVISVAFPYVAILTEVPDLATAITVSGYTRVYAMPQNVTDFFVDRTGNVYFHQSKKGLTVTITYMGGGSRLTASDWNEMVDTLASTNVLINGLTSLVFGNIKMVVTPSTITTAAGTLNTKNSGQHVVSFTATLKTNDNVLYTWLRDIPLYVEVRGVFVDSDITAPVISPAVSTLKFQQGSCQLSARYLTDYGQYKKYTAGDYVSYTFTTVDPVSNIGINLSNTVIDSIQ